MTTGEKINQCRKKLNYTQEELSDILHVSRQAVSKWESDMAFPETDKLIAMSKMFECSTDYLLKDDVDFEGKPLKEEVLDSENLLLTIFSFVPLLGVIFGIIGLKKKKSLKGLKIFGMIISISFFVFLIICISLNL